MVVLGDLGGGLNPKNMSSSIGMITVLPRYGKIKNVPNHQPGIILGLRGLTWDYLGIKLPLPRSKCGTVNNLCEKTSFREASKDVFARSVFCATQETMISSSTCYVVGKL